MKNVITTFKPGEERKTSPRVFQWDYGQMLVVHGLALPEYYEVHFCNAGDEYTVTLTGDRNGVRIPDEMIYAGKDIYAYIYLHQEETDGETEYIIRIPIIRRPKPSDIAPGPEEQTTIGQLIDEMNDAANRAQSARRTAEGWAVGTRDGVPVAPGDEAYQNNAKYYAGIASQGAEGAGYAWFDVTDADGCMWVTITPDLGQDIQFLVNENTGELEVHY